ncbi:Putative ABC transport system permease protein [hydrothermal vent metagenome]|uniref:Putative ABC transport system permease protein n=1 Tax=hydrothermal vent metagenome TaxID=652676 RepID=A0A1W1EE11_9ZZZZ
MDNEYIKYKKNQHQIVLYSTGEWTLKSLSKVRKELAKVPYDKEIVWDLSSVEDFDSAGVLLFIEFYELFKDNTKVSIVGYTSNQNEMYKLLKSTHKDIEAPQKDNLLVNLGKKVYNLYNDILDFIKFFGELFQSTLHSFLNPRNIRFKEMVYHIHKSGFDALIIIGLTSFLVGMVIAYQGSVQLEKFGADMFIVDTVAISIVRELGPMITAIVIAGRSGSAYTAEIGAMKITEEISAMRTMGFDPYNFLVLPRIFALMIALPLLIFFSDIMGIFGGMVAANMQLNISYAQFAERLYEVLEAKHYILGMIKGPVFAFIIATVGCFRGLQVSDNTESIGLHTTASVVNSIFLVIAFDALFSVIYTELGL